MTVKLITKNVESNKEWSCGRFKDGVSSVGSFSVSHFFARNWIITQIRHGSEQYVDQMRLDRCVGLDCFVNPRKHLRREKVCDLVGLLSYATVRNLCVEYIWIIDMRSIKKKYWRSPVERTRGGMSSEFCYFRRRGRSWIDKREHELDWRSVQKRRLETSTMQTCWYQWLWSDWAPVQLQYIILRGPVRYHMWTWFYVLCIGRRTWAHSEVTQTKKNGYPKTSERLKITTTSRDRQSCQWREWCLTWERDARLTKMRWLILIRRVRGRRWWRMTSTMTSF